MGTTHKTRRVPAAPVKDAGKERISLIVDAKLRKTLEALARAEMRTLNAQCELLLKRGVAKAVA